MTMTTMLTVRLAEDERNELRRRATERGVSVSAVVREALGVRPDPVRDLRARLDEIDRRLAVTGPVETSAA